MFLPWVDIGIATRNGLEQGTVLLLLLQIYPLIYIYKGKSYSRLMTILLNILAIGATVLFIFNKTIDAFDRKANVAGYGAFGYLLITLITIILEIRKAIPNNVPDR